MAQRTDDRGTRLGILVADADLVVRSWDDGLAAMTGIPSRTACGQRLTDLIPDLESRGILGRVLRVLHEGSVEALSPAFHGYLLPCAPLEASDHFDRMQQRVTLAPLRQAERVVGVMATVEDVTSRLDRERTLAGDLSSPEEGKRLRAAEELASLDEEASTHLLPSLGDESWRVRKAAVEGLARHGTRHTVAALLRNLREQHRDMSVLNSALQVLALMDMDTLSPLLEFLQDPDAELRTYAAMLLGERQEVKAVPDLIRALEDPDPNVRYHAIESLGKLRAGEAVERLVAVAGSGDFFLAFPALDALARIGDPIAAPRLVPLLEDPLLRSPAAEALGQLGSEEAVGPLVSLLNRAGAPAGVVAQALAVIHDHYQRIYQEGAHVADLVRRWIQPAGAQNLLDALGDAPPEDLRALALALGWLEGPAVERALTRLLGQPAARREVVEALVRHGARVVDLLLEQVGTEDLETRQAAIIALGRIGNARAVPALLQVLTQDPELVVVAAGALAKIGDRQAMDGLLRLLGHPDAAVRQAAVGALNSIGHPGMADIVRELLSNPDATVRESAVRIAGYFGYDSCVETMIALCRDPDEAVRRAVVEHIPFQEDPRGPALLARTLAEDTPRVRASAARALAHLNRREALPLVANALRDPDPWVRYFAALSAGRLALGEMVEDLGRVAQTDEADHARIAAAKALGWVGGERAVSILKPLLEAGNDDLAVAAMSGLGRIGLPEAQSALVAALRSPEPARRLGAVRALGEAGGKGVAHTLQWMAATDPDPEVALEALHSLVGMATPEAVKALVGLTADPRNREACVEALARLEEVHAAEIALGLGEANVEVRLAVVEALARMRCPLGTEHLLAALRDASSRVRLAAVVALGRLGTRRAERELASLAHGDASPEVRKAALKALEA